MKLEIPRGKAADAAGAICRALLADGCCNRAEIAGSIRRQKPIVGDLEVVAQLSDDFGAANRVGNVLSGLGVLHGLPDKAGKRAPWGPRYYRARVPANGGELALPLDLFVVFPPATWAVVYLIRTGSADFSHSFVSRLRTFGLRSEDGRILSEANIEIAVEDERRLFDLCRLPYLEPPERDTTNDRTRSLLARPGG